MTDALQLLSTARDDGTLALSLARVPITAPADDGILVEMHAAPINPSDLGLLVGVADVRSARRSGTGDDAVTVLDVPEPLRRAMAGRIGEPMPVGNEGAGVVVQAGASPAAQALLGKTVALVGGATYATHRAARASEVLLLPEGTSAEEGAAWFVNPMTALAMLETMRREGHGAIVHTAAASSLGQMLIKLCRADGVPLVNVVRRPEQVAMLRALGAEHALSSEDPSFFANLVAAAKETGATLAFDAVGGGPLAGQILAAMEAALSTGARYSRYGSSTHKQVYVYGALDMRPTEIPRSVGFAWGVSSFLLTYFLQKAGPEVVGRMRARVAAELKTTFATRYSDVISLRDVLDPAIMARYAAKATGAKFLVDPR